MMPLTSSVIPFSCAFEDFPSVREGGEELEGAEEGREEGVMFWAWGMGCCLSR